MEIISRAEKDTEGVAFNLASQIRGGEVLALQGDLGSGKTTFTKYFAKALGIKELVTSPTYVIMKSYDFSRNGQKLQLFHIDAYRLHEPSDAESVGLHEIIGKAKTVTVVEWPEKIRPFVPLSARLIEFEYISENCRKITIN